MSWPSVELPQAQLPGPIRTTKAGGAWQHPPEPSPTPSVINAYRALVLIVLHVFSASTQHLHSEPLTLQPRVSD